MSGAAPVRAAPLGPAHLIGAQAGASDADPRKGKEACQRRDVFETCGKRGTEGRPGAHVKTRHLLQIRLGGRGGSQRSESRYGRSDKGRPASLIQIRFGGEAAALKEAQ